MDSNKPGIFTRLRRTLSGVVGDAVESLSDPGQEIALMLDDLAAQIGKAEHDLRDAVVQRKLLERKLEDVRREQTAWEERASSALKLGDENLARAALQRKQESTRLRLDTEAALAEQVATIDQMQVFVRESKAKLKALNLRRSSLMSKARAAKSGVPGGSVATSAIRGAGSRIEEIESRIAEVEALNEVEAETRDAEVEAAAIDARLAALGAGESKVDLELERLKAKMRAAPALKKGDDEAGG